ncbi:hypothetical protein GCM10009682_13930 [Luedemannella flava]|uniref:Secreted protein n=1 Tax=Luedemannella flava TaxID=349316 RepID=A0ABP4XSU5_9ACTN
MEPPVWLLDVDGVLNVQRPGWGAAPRRGMAVSMGEAWPMRWAPALIRRIREIHRTGVAEVRWCSTWCPDADQVERLFGLPPLARALTGRPRAGMAGDAAKLAAAQAVISDEGRALIWTDDTAVPDEGPWCDLMLPGRRLLIRPRAARGLQPGHLDAIEVFASESV